MKSSIIVPLVEKGNNTVYPLIKDSTKYAISKVVPGLCSFLAVALFIRIIGNEQYGRYALAFSFVSVSSALFMGWIKQSLQRYYQRYVTIPVAKKSIITALVLSTLAGTVTLALINAFGFNAYSSYSWPTLILIVVLFGALNCYELYTVLLQAQIRPNRIILLNGTQAILGLILPVIFLLLIKKTYPVILLALIFSYALPLFLMASWPSRDIDTNLPMKYRVKAKLFINHAWQYGWPLSLWIASSSMLQVTDRYLIQHYFSFTETGTYAGIYDVIVRGYSFLFFPITLGSQPYIMKYWNLKKRKDAMSALIFAIVGQLLLFVITIGIFLVFSNSIIELMGTILNSSDNSFSTLILPLLVGGFLWQLALLVHKPLELSGKTIWMLFSAMAALITSMLGNYYFLPIYGVIAAAYMLIVSAGVYLCICLVLSRWAHIRIKQRGKG